MRRLPLAAVLFLAAAFALPAVQAREAPEDPFLWLEEVEGEKALAWVEEQKRREPRRADEAPRVRRDRGAHARRPRGRRPPRRRPLARRLDVRLLARRGATAAASTAARPSASYLAGTPKWEVVLDLDALAEKEGQELGLEGDVAAASRLHARPAAALGRGLGRRRRPRVRHPVQELRRGRLRAAGGEGRDGLDRRRHGVRRPRTSARAR